jgi:NADP-dependent 3-hydroxy acid dehydrogenase YdfG
MIALENHVAVVTGASSGIGKAIALSLSSQGTSLCLVGRNMAILQRAAEHVKSINRAASLVKTYQVDLRIDREIDLLREQIQKDFGSIDVLIHSAGLFHMGKVEQASARCFDEQYQVNVRAPYLLTQAMLPMIRSRAGQVVFINSSLGRQAKAKVSQYAATKHALRAVADSLREEVNADGIRVLSIYLGRTATPMQVAIYEAEGRMYQPERLMQPEDVAAAVVNVLTLPRSVEVTDFHVRPLHKSD